MPLYIGICDLEFLYMAAPDSGGNPIDFEVTGGEVHDSKMAPQLIAKLPPSEYLIADKGYDSEDLRMSY